MISHTYTGSQDGRWCWVQTKDGVCRKPGVQHKGYVPPVKTGLSTDEVREAFQYGAIDDVSGDDFDAWLHKIQAEARVAALEEAASKVHSRFQYGWLSTAEADKVASWLRDLKDLT